MTIDDFSKIRLPNLHYLKIAHGKGHKYFHDFLTISDKFKTILPSKDFEKFWNEKMQLNKKTFNEKAFIQSACEIAVANYFSEKKDFGIDVKVNPHNEKDVDCQFKSNTFIYNIEVKCASFDAKENIENSDSFKFQTFGRIPEREKLFLELSKALDESLTNQGKPLKEHQELKSMDNNLKTFLELANNKFKPNSLDNEVNILLVGCNDPADIQSWIGYLFASEGLFTNESYANVSNYQHVDLVVFTNLYFKHKDFFHKNIDSSWSLEQSLNLYFENPFRNKEKRSGIDNFYYELKNYNSDFNRFKVKGQVPIEVQEAVKTPHFVIDYLEKERSIYLFEKKK